MIFRSEVEEKFYHLCSKAVAECGLEIYDVEFIGKDRLVVYIFDLETKTATIDQCVNVDRAMTPYFEDENGEYPWIPEEVTLEVSSPGVFRHLRFLEHFQGAVGEKVEFSTKNSLGDILGESCPRKMTGAKKFKAKLMSIEDNDINLAIDSLEFRVSLDTVKKANVSPDI